MADESIEFNINAKDNASSVLGGVGKAFGYVSAAVTAATAALTAAVVQSARAQDEMLKLSQRTNTTVGEFSALAHAASLADVSNEKVAVTLAFISRATTEAAEGVKEYKDEFDRLGITVTDTNGRARESTEILAELADHIKENGVSAETMAAGMSVAGRGFNEMIPLLRQGSEGLRKAAEDARFLGLELSQQGAANAELFNDSITRMKGATQGASHAFSNELTPILSGVIQQVTNFIATNRQFFTELGQGVANALVYAIATFEAFGTVSSQVFSKFQEWFSSAKGFEDFVENAGRAFSYVLDVAQLAIGNIGVIMVQAFQLAWESFFELAKWGWQKVFDFFTGQNLADSLGEVLFSRIPEATQKTRDETKAILGEMGADWVDMGQRAADGLSNAFGVVMPDIAARAAELKGVLTALGTAEVEESDKAATATEANLLRQLEARKLYLTEKNALIAQDLLTENEQQAIQDELTLLNLQIAQERKFLSAEEFGRRKETLLLQQRAREGDIEAQFRLNQQKWDQASYNERLKIVSGYFGEAAGLMQSGHGAMFQIGKGAALAMAFISGEQAIQNALATPPWIPTGLAMGALAVTKTALQINKIRGASLGGVAHDGLTNVPREGTFLLDRGERVLSPEQNRDLTNFLGASGAGGLTIGTLQISILENATNFDALMAMSPQQISELVAEKIYAAMDSLALRGIQPTALERQRRT